MSLPTTTSDTTPQHFAEEFLAHLQLDRAVDLERAGRRDVYAALAHTVRDRLMSDWLDTVRNRGRLQSKTVVYLSAEYLMGRQLGNALLATGLTDIAREALAGLGLDLDEVYEMEVEPGLGNGGLGRLAACFADSLATLGRPAIGYGILYEYGIFEQSFEDGRQVEKPDQWLDHDNPWLFAQREHAVSVGFGGHVEVDPATGDRTWFPAEKVLGVPHNLMVPGYDNNVVNTLRLWKARGSSQFNLEVFNAGDYIEAVRQQSMSENISRVLYPEDSTPGRQGAAPAPAVLLHRVRAGRPRPGGRPRGHPADRDPRPGEHPAQRHPPGDRDPRAHAHPDRRARHGLRAGVGHHQPHVQLHLPHAAARGPRALERRPAAVPAAAAHGAHLPDEQALPGEGARGVPERPVPRDQHVDHRGGPERMVRMAHLATVGQRARQRRGRAAQPAAARDGPARLRRDVARAVHERHQRRDPATVHQAGQPPPERPHHRGRRRRLAHRPGQAQRAGVGRRRPGVPGAVARGEAGQQGRARDPARGPDRARVTRPIRCTTS